jgi:hypothetical protein
MIHYCHFGSNHSLNLYIGECIGNPGYMWSSCHTSCLGYARDAEDPCEQWAKEGECTNNPSYIHLHCPKSCKMAISWSPWARRSAGVRDLLPYHEDYMKDITSCTDPVDMVGAADFITQQLQLYMEGGSRMTTTFISTSPTEYLGRSFLVYSWFSTRLTYFASQT